MSADLWLFRNKALAWKLPFGAEAAFLHTWVVCFYYTTLHMEDYKIRHLRYPVSRFRCLCTKTSYQKYDLKDKTATLLLSKSHDKAFPLNLKTNAKQLVNPHDSPASFFRQGIWWQGLHGAVQLQRAVGTPLAGAEERLQPSLPAGLQLQGEYKAATRRKD